MTAPAVEVIVDLAEQATRAYPVEDEPRLVLDTGSLWISRVNPDGVNGRCQDLLGPGYWTAARVYVDGELVEVHQPGD